MSINKKVFILFSIVFIFLSLVFYTILQERENHSLVFENSLVEKKILNLNNVLKDRLEILNNISYEYSMSDDLIKSIRSKNSDFTDYDSISAKLNISYFILLDSKKSILYAQSYDINSQEFLDIPDDIEDFFKTGQIEDYINDKNELRFLTLNYEKLIFSFDKIDDIGYVFIARTIDSTFLSNISLLLDSYVTLRPSYKFNNLQMKKFIFNYDIKRPSEKFLYANIKLIDEIDNSSFFFSLKIDRYLYIEVSNSNFILLSLFVISLIVLNLIIYLFINKIFIKRIGNISSTVRNISKNKELVENIELVYDDEITYLSKKMNEMFSILNDKQNENIKKERDFLQSVLDSQQHIIFITDGNSIQSANKKFLDIFKSNNCFLDNIALLDNNIKSDILKIAKNHSSFDNPAKLKIDDEHKYFIFDISRVEIEKYIICMNDISKYNEKITDLKNKASIDELTKCYNKATIIEYSKYWLETKSFGLVVLDIDKFKYINDTYGHLVGDHILRDLAVLITNHLQKSDIIGRFGGEEFLILLDDKQNNIENISNRIRKVVENYIFICNDLELKITVSLGCTFCNIDENYEKLFNIADEALYEAKNSGRNRVVYKILL